MTERAITERVVAVPPIENCSIELGGCEVIELNVGLYEHEKVSLRFDTWPKAAQVKVEEAIESYLKRKPGSTIVMFSTSVRPLNAIALVHYRTKG